MSVIRFVLVLAVGLFCAAPPALAQVDEKTLEALSRDNPKGYYDYAKNLAGQPGDRDTAIHLYLIAAYLAPDKYGSDSLLAMSKLAATPAEARKYRAMAYVLDPNASPDSLKDEAGTAGSAPRPDKSQAAALENAKKAWQLYRAGNIPKAIEAAKNDGVDEIFRMVPGGRKMDREKFLTWCSDVTCKRCPEKKVRGVKILAGTIVCPTCKGYGGPINGLGQRLGICPICKGKGILVCPDCGGQHFLDRPPDVVRDVLRAELWALDQDGAGEVVATTHPKSWSTALQSHPVSPLKLETIADFDPRKWRRHDGKWE